MKVLQNLWQSQRHVAGNRRSTVGAVESGGPSSLGMFALRGREAEPQEEAAITFIGRALCALSKAFSLSCTYDGIMTIERMKKELAIYTSVARLAHQRLRGRSLCLPLLGVGHGQA